MLKKIFQNLFKSKKEPEPEVLGNYIVATLNDKIMPMARGDVYEDLLDEFLKKMNYGEVTGGGTLQQETGEIEYCDIEICLNSDQIDLEIIKQVINKLEELGAPKGSTLLIEKTGEKIPFGVNEGLGIYLDGINLSEEVYKNSDSEAIALEICRLTNINSEVLRYWNGNTETALYFYDHSFEKMYQSIESFVKTNPECENSRIVQIA
jgi:hypothetical protein